MNCISYLYASSYFFNMSVCYSKLPVLGGLSGYFQPPTHHQCIWGTDYWFVAELPHAVIIADRRKNHQKNSNF